MWEITTVKAGHRRVRYRLSLISPAGDRVAGYDNYHPKLVFRSIRPVISFHCGHLFR